MNPPLLMRLLLNAVSGEGEAEFAAGDLHEEFLTLCAERGTRAARRWYSWQVIRSVAPMCGMRMRKGEIAHVSAAAGIGVALPLLLLDRLWCFVYSLIPLKDGLQRGPALLAVNVICACTLAALCGTTATSQRRAAAVAVATAGAAAFGVWGSVGQAPALYAWLLLLAAPAGTLVAFRLKRRFL
jgi:hypothetical protein